MDAKGLQASISNDKPVELVYPLLDTDNSRWFFFSSACRPFGMVNLSPDTEVDNDWGAGYRYNTTSIKGFSHIHAWQLSGVSVMPVTYKKGNEASLFRDFYSDFDHRDEVVEVGFHSVWLKRYNIKAELTSTKRTGFHRYLFAHKDSLTKNGILFNLNGILGPCENSDGKLELTDAHTLMGSLVDKPTRRRPKPFVVYFDVVFNEKIESLIKDSSTGNYLVKFSDDCSEVLMKVGISYTSAENAALNLKKENPEWNFNKIVQLSKDEWNRMLGRIEIEGNSTTEKRRFYTDLWHSLQGRRIISDVNGAYPNYMGKEFRIGQIPLDAKGSPQFNHFNSDAFWGAQWTINTLWGLVYPEIYKEFVSSLMLYFKDGGLVPRGPAGGNYTYVMTGAPSTPFIVSAIQKGIVKDGLEEIYYALKKNHEKGGIMAKGGYEHNTSKGGGLDYYIENGYVPYPNPDRSDAFHQDGAGLTLEYAYQDYTLAQLANKLGKKGDYQYYMGRSKNYKNVFDNKTGWMRPKDINGNWSAKFDPFEYEHGFIESNSAQATWFVPHDLEGLAALMGGKKTAVEKLNKSFKEAEKLEFTSGTSHETELHPEYKRIPINYGNQPSIQTAFVFNKLGRPDLEQYWSRKVVEKVFSGLSHSRGYNGDEDQGLMGSLAVLMKIGLFQLDGGTSNEPVYQIGSPIFDKVIIHLNKDFYKGDKLIISVYDNSLNNNCVRKVFFNGKEVIEASIPHSLMINGGNLKLFMSPLSMMKNN